MRPVALIKSVNGLKAHGGKLIAGGYNKATAIDGVPPPNRVLIFQYPNKEVSDKAWSESIKPWQMSEQVRKLADFRVFGVEAVEQR
jgi:hypothetical protein